MLFITVIFRFNQFQERSEEKEVDEEREELEDKEDIQDTKRFRGLQSAIDEVDSLFCKADYQIP